MTDLTQRPLIPIGLGPRAAQPPDPERGRVAADPPVAANASTEGELDAPEVAGVIAPATTVTPGETSLEAAIEGLARDAAALREAVARFEIAGSPADAAQLDDAPLLDTLAREQRVREDTIELTRGLARITTQSALLLVKFTDSAVGFLKRFAAAGDATPRTEWRGLATWVGAGVGLAGVAAVVAALALLQARENARQADRLQQALVQSISDNALAQTSAVHALEARMRELTSREAAIVAAIQAAAHAAEAEAAARREPPAKPAAGSRNAKRKPAR